MMNGLALISIVTSISNGDRPAPATRRAPIPFAVPRQPRSRRRKPLRPICRVCFPDARGAEADDAAPADTSGVFLDIHSHGQTHTGAVGATRPQRHPTGRSSRRSDASWRFSTDTRRSRLIGLYQASGTTDAYSYGELGIASYTFELGTTFFQDCDSFEETIVPQNVQSLRYALKVARTPYITPAGPDAVGVSLSAGSVAPGVLPDTLVTLSETLNDGRYSTANGTEPEQTIAAGEYYVDVPPWGENPSAVALWTPEDGVFDETEEDATASIDTTGWSPGRHHHLRAGQGCR